jgi:serine/threonine protein kinase
MVDLIGQEIGNYRLMSRLASGGFGNVYLSQHTLLPERRVAIKLLHTFLSSQEERDQFLQEARFLEQLKHPFILPLIDVGISDNLPYQVTEYASGGSLRDILKQHQSSGLPQNIALTILSQICQALQYAHQRQVIHRDLKPENILFNEGIS